MDTKAMAALKWGGLATAICGIGFVLSLAAPGVLEWFYGLIGPGQEPTMTPAAQLGVAIFGGIMTGWGVMMYAAGRGMQVTRAAALGLLSWWVVDSSGSVAVGFPLNALANLAFLSVFTPLFIAVWGRQGKRQVATA